MQRNLGSKFRSANNLIYLGLGCLSIGLIGAFGWFFLESNFKTHRLTLVAGSKDGESYILSKALERVVEAKNPQIQIDVVETKGTEENIEKLEKGEAQLATAQADIHISNIIGLMKSVQEKQISAKVGLEELDKVFAQAATDLIEEKISQESFRTLSEAYKATRDVIAHQTDTPNEKSDRIPKIRA